MSNYPFSFDNNITLPGVSGSTQEDVAITALRSAVFAIETELGVTPSGIYPDVRTRLDILEARILFSTSGIAPGILNDGYVKSPLFIFNIPQNVMLSISDGYGAPTENRLDGSIYMRGGDGYANNQLYVRLNGNWYPVQTEQFQAANDLAPFTSIPGNPDGHLAQTVVGLYNHPFNPAMNTVGLVQDGYHVTWNNGLAEWEAQTGFIPTHDLAAFSGPYGRTGQIVTGIQGSHVSPAAPIDGYTLVWSATDAAWEPRARAVIFGGSITAGDGYITRVNIRSNKLPQSPSTNTSSLVGMVNFGTSTNGSGGTSNNYAMLLGGDRGTASGLFSLVVGGYTNTAADGYSTVVNGSGNLASVANSVILNGTTNTASGIQSTVLNGTSNTSSGTNSTVGNGTNNSAAANFSTVLNGATNTISAGSIHTLISSGHDNQITGGLAGEHSVILGGDNNIVNNANNVLIGTTSTSSSQGDFSIILSGVSNTIANLSDYTAILSGISNSITVSSEFSFIGSGNNNSVTGHYASILTADTSIVNSLHGMIVNGANNSVTGSYGTIINGNNNSVTAALGYGLILDGYNNAISGTGGFVADGYNNIVNGPWSSILNGNFNTINGRNSTILNSSGNIIDANSTETTVLTGSNNTFTNSANSTAVGASNTFTNAASTFIIGTLNQVQSTASFINGSANILSSGTSFNRLFGSNNVFGTGASTSFAVGNGNSIAPATATSNTFAFGSNNVIDGANGSSVNGNSNIATANVTNVHGQYGKARLFGQEVRANGRFTGTTVAGASIGQTLPQATINVVSTTNFPASGTIAINTSAGLQTVNYTATTLTTLTGCTGGTGTMSATSGVGKIGETQWSRLILDGYSTSVGAAVPLQLQDTILSNPTFVDGYSYDMSIKILIVNTSPISPNPVVPARFYIDVLAHQESGVLVLDNINTTLSTPNTVDSPTRTPWTISVSTAGNQMVLQVDAEVPSSYVQPTNSPSLRRAVATIDMREISRI